MDRGALVMQMAKALAGGVAEDHHGFLNDDLRRRADEALARVEVYLGVEIEEAKEIVSKVIEDV